jgi:hypothetical protein
MSARMRRKEIGPFPHGPISIPIPTNSPTLALSHEHLFLSYTRGTMPFKIPEVSCDDNTETAVPENMIRIHSRRADKCPHCAETIWPGSKAYVIAGAFGSKYCSVACVRVFCEACE